MGGVGSVWGESEQAMHLRLVFFSPADVEPPPGAGERMRAIAEYAQAFYTEGMKRWAYEPAQALAIERDEEGEPVVYWVRGEKDKASGRYDQLGFGEEIIRLAREEYGIAEGPDVWWFFLWQGPEKGWGRGMGTVKNGGRANAGYFDEEGEVTVGDDLGGGFLEAIKLKGAMHELGHGFGLPHIGPKGVDDLGNTLMGPTNAAFETRGMRGDDSRVYLSEAAAAMLWKHPLFTGTSEGHAEVPAVRLQDFSASFDEEEGVLTVKGTVRSNGKAHSVVVGNESKKMRTPYWRKTFVGRVGDDGSFEVKLDEVDETDGLLRIAFCFENGAITGGKRALGFDRTGIEKVYRFVDGDFVFSDPE